MSPGPGSGAVARKALDSEKIKRAESELRDSIAVEVERFKARTGLEPTEIHVDFLRGIVAGIGIEWRVP